MKRIAITFICYFLLNTLYAQHKAYQGQSSSEVSLQLNNSESFAVNSALRTNQTKLRDGDSFVLKPIKIGLTNPQPVISASTIWEGKGLNPDAIKLYYRFAKQKGKWSSWKASGFDAHFSDNGERISSTMMILEADTKYIQYKAVLNSTAQLKLNTIHSNHFSPGATTKAAKQAMLRNTATSCIKPPVVSRSQWGAKAPRSSISTSKVTHLIVHHEYGSNYSSDWAARVRAIQQLHFNNKWSDVGYNFLIDRNGVIYEGRAGGDNAVGAHFCGKNRNTMAVCLLGNYSSSSEIPSAAVQNSLKKILAWKAAKEKINPLGSSYHYSGQTLRHIIGHRDNPDKSCTACPGDGAYSVLSSIRNDVAALVNSGCGGTPYADLNGHWAEKECRYMINNKLMSGYPDQTFRPNNSVTRAEFAAMLVSVLNPKQSTNPTIANRNFNDISGHWAASRILRAARSGYMSGYPDGTFRPNNKVTRVEIYAALQSGLGIASTNLSLLNKYSDQASIASWARGAVAKATQGEIVHNYPSLSKLNPARNASRAEAAAALYQMLVRKGSAPTTNNAYLVRVGTARTSQLVADEEVYTLYPNPASTTLHIHATNRDQGNIVYVIYDMTLGSKVQEGKLHPKETAINIEQLRPGNYILKVKDSKGLKHYTFIKK
jgi:hypothetical protein